MVLHSSVGANDSGLTYSGGGSVQGLWRRPNPIAYLVSGRHEHDDGNRDNNGSDHQALQVQLGSSFREQSHNLLFNLTAQHFDQQLPGTRIDNDPDDDRTDELLFADLGYSFRINQRNRIMVRVAGGYEETRFANGSPFGRGLSRVEYSLFGRYGLAASAFFNRVGLYDFTPLRTGGFEGVSTILVAGADAQFFCGGLFAAPCPPDKLTFGGQYDFDSTVNETLNVNKRQFQLRHLLDLGPVEFTYGAEYARFGQHTVSNAIIPRASGGMGYLFAFTPPQRNCPHPCLFNGPDFDRFAPIDPVQQRFSQSNSADAIEAYVQARWKINSSLWLEGGAFYRDIDLGEDEKQQIDPRVGLAWRITPQHWLRISSQSALIDPLRTQDTLAPVATVGTVIPDEIFITVSNTLAATWYHQLRWDAQWSPRFYTFVQLDRQDIEDFALGSAPESRYAIHGPFLDGRLDTVSFGSNVWLGERLGLSASYKYLWAAPTSVRFFDLKLSGLDLPLIPEQEFHSRLVWVHPRAVTLGLTGDYVGQRAGGPFNGDPLAAYWTAGAYANWQPFARHLSLTLENLLDADYELAADFPGVGRSVLFSAEYRF